MRLQTAYISNIAAKASECAGNLFRGNDSLLPGIGAWETRMA
jgi:hypothetical protein